MVVVLTTSLCPLLAARGFIHPVCCGHMSPSPGPFPHLIPPINGSQTALEPGSPGDWKSGGGRAGSRWKARGSGKWEAGSQAHSRWPHRDEFLFLVSFLPLLSPCCGPVCQILPKGVVAVLGPSSSPASSSIISNICGEKEVSAGQTGRPQAAAVPTGAVGSEASGARGARLCH